ncbi:MAG: EamA family transporter [Phenylobacterium sp.]
MARDEASGPKSVLLPLAATLCAMACFQVGAAIAKGLYPAVGPQGAATLRLGLGAGMLIVLMRPWRAWPKDARLAPRVGLGVSAGAAVLFFYTAIERLPLGVAISLQFLGPLGVAVLSSRRASDIVWSALGAVGVWSLVGVGGAKGAIDPWGVASALAAACGWACYILCGRVAGAAFGRATAALATGIAALVVAPVGIATAGAALLNPQILPLALLVAVISTAIPFSLEIYALPRLPARTFAVFTSLEPACGVISGAFVLHEWLRPAQIAGVALVVAAAAGAAWTSVRKDKAATDVPVT